MEKIIVSVPNATVVSVEKGSILSKPENPVIAFTVEFEGVRIKSIVKGSLANALWHNFLNNGRTQDQVAESFGFDIDKRVTISFIGTVKDYRKEGLVLEDLYNIEVNFNYSLA